MSTRLWGWSVVGGIVATVAIGTAACSGVGGDAGEKVQTREQGEEQERELRLPTTTWQRGDEAEAIVLRNPEVSVSLPVSSRALRDAPDAVPFDRTFEHEPGRNPYANIFSPIAEDPAAQTALPRVSMPATVHDFLGQGWTTGGCISPTPDGGQPPGCTTRGDPPDTVGAVGPNHYVQLVNSGIGVWDKTGKMLITPKYTSALWAGYPGTDGNLCANTPQQGGDWGDAVVVYDQLADRWFITQFDITNGVNNNAGPSFQCVAVSKTGDPTGEYWLYDFKYNAAINDYGKFSAWPDGYYASFNEFSASSYLDARLCAYDRAKMLQGQPATQQCFTNSGFGFLPSNVDGPIKPPNGTPAFFVTLQSSTRVAMYKFHVDWATPANSTFALAANLTVTSYSGLCNGGSCVKQPSPGNALASLGDRPMFHLGYRNFGTVESLTFNHSVTSGTTGGSRWYEIRSPNATPAIFQQGTYAPADGKYRWMGSIAMDQAQDMALGFAASSSTTKPGIGWTGRTAADTKGTMGQAETIIDTGAGVESGTFSDGTSANRYGDYSNMTVDPTDDCTFWYTQELYPANGIFNWDTRVASVKFPNCAANDFTISLSPATQSVAPGAQVTYTVTTTSAKGTAESLDLVVEDLPSGVTGTLNPTTVTAGGTSTLTVSAAAGAPNASNVTFMVIGKATSAVHAANAVVNVGQGCVPLTQCPAPDNCGSVSDGCGGMVNCGTCSGMDTCGGGGMANVCGCTPIAMCPAGDNCGTVSNGCGGMVTCGACSGSDTCVNNHCVAPGVDAGNPGTDSGTPPGNDAGTGPTDSGVPPRRDAGKDSGSNLVDAASDDGGDNQDTGGGSSGCGCRTVDATGSSSSWAAFGVFGLAALGVARRRRRRLH